MSLTHPKQEVSLRRAAVSRGLFQYDGCWQQAMASVTPFLRNFEDEPAVQGFLHTPANPSGDAAVFAHGAGGNSQSPLLVAIGEALANRGVLVLRCDLPFRQRRPKGPPSGGAAVKDREGLRRAVAAVRELVKGRVYLGGQSYGGRQATLLAAQEPDLVDGLLLTSYPLHPPGKPERLRTDHFPRLQVPVLFCHGSKDPFGTLDEVRQALKLIPARTQLIEFEGGSHGLASQRAKPQAYREVGEKVAEACAAFFR